MKVGTHPPTTRRRRRPSQGWHPEDIKAALRKRGVTLAALSRRHGYSPEAVGLVVRGARTSAPLRQIVARELGVPVTVLWPAHRRGS